MSEESDNPYASPPPGWQPPPAPPGPPYPAAPGWGPPGSPPYAAGPYAPYGPPPGYPPYGYPMPSTSTNGLAIASLVCAIALSWLLGLGGILGVTFGIIGLRQCNRRGERGRGLAIAGIVVGGLVVAFWILALVAGVTSSSSGSGSGSLGALAAGGYRAAW